MGCWRRWFCLTAFSSPVRFLETATRFGHVTQCITWRQTRPMLRKSVSSTDVPQNEGRSRSKQQQIRNKLDWLVVWTPLKNMKVNWDDDIPNINGKIKLMFQTTNQLKNERFRKEKHQKHWLLFHLAACSLNVVLHNVRRARCHPLSVLHLQQVCAKPLRLAAISMDLRILGQESNFLITKNRLSLQVFYTGEEVGTLLVMFFSCDRYPNSFSYVHRKKTRDRPWWLWDFPRQKLDKTSGVSIIKVPTTMAQIRGGSPKSWSFLCGKNLQSPNER